MNENDYLFGIIGIARVVLGLLVELCALVGLPGIADLCQIFSRTFSKNVGKMR